MASGIYWIYQVSKDRAVYVGSTACFHRRFIQHRSALKLGTASNPRLQRTWNKYGEGDLEFKVLEECPPDRLIEREQWWADALAPTCTVGPCVVNGTRGRKLTDEQRYKCGNGNRGKKRGPRDEETKRKIGDAHRGRKLPAEQIRKMAASLTGRKLTEETRKKLSAARMGNQRAKDPSDEIRLKISAAQKQRFAKPDAVSEETRRKLSEAAKADWARRRDYKHTEDARQNMSDSQKARWARKRSLEKE